MNKDIVDIVAELKSLQSSINKGKGLDCVNTVIFFLEINCINKAIACIRNEWDKISAYDTLASYMNKLVVFLENYV